MGCCHEKRVNEPPLFATSEAGSGHSAWQRPAAGYILFKNEAKDLVSVCITIVCCIISVNVDMNDLKLL